MPYHNTELAQIIKNAVIIGASPRKSTSPSKYLIRPSLLGLFGSLLLSEPLLPLTFVPLSSTSKSEGGESVGLLLLVGNGTRSLGGVRGGERDGVTGDVGGEVVTLQFSVNGVAKENRSALTVASPALGLPAFLGKTTNLDLYSLSLSTLSFWPSSDLDLRRGSTEMPRDKASFLLIPASLSSEVVKPRPSVTKHQQPHTFIRKSAVR